MVDRAADRGLELTIDGNVADDIERADDRLGGLAYAALLARRAKLRRQDRYVFGGTAAYTADMIEAARQRLINEYGAPAFDWQALRSTCATYLTNAPAIFGAATAYMSARQLGHPVAVAERHYLGVHGGIATSANTLEAAMQITDPVRAVVGGYATIGRSDSAPRRGRPT